MIDESAEGLESLCFSAGKIGYQVETTLKDLERILRFTCADVTDQKGADYEV